MDDSDVYSNLTYKRIGNAKADIEEKKAAVNKLMEEYSTLKNTICSLPEKLVYKTQVPLSKKGFFIGELNHTNEIEVHVGTGVLAKQSASSAAAIIDNRLKNMREELEHLDKELALCNQDLKAMESYVAESGEVEIIEEMTEYECLQMSQGRPSGDGRGSAKENECDTSSSTTVSDDTSEEELQEDEKCSTMTFLGTCQGNVKPVVSSFVQKEPGDEPASSLSNAAEQSSVPKKVSLFKQRSLNAKRGR
ncbi:Unconventional prefoldin RPB5 interactor [Trichinella pseudospiralis]|uniref:Unconventional prefoldin RPB5 interactor n=2 Tax=Trichinella pseudospiralis TaxID=6337 RepID=A0A0V1JLT1_TRIPS|nr:Unconventional prefoldin RPB5 interactor [Trichinella pseudospiralis]KRY70485.1 Unconventional prefoldin RPB5 interactor [Trichinella pseudospiralis]KRY86327.1 Unconventional prefoldin RPB5 interactor [Trichinella pseudospiralis]KRZ19854.1 Unconventional prefoldin RPB5 interactor [Trichinella pseudospiralis]KRZ35887.1 Unconventional prefoldin RPB5 interactor [Trichinella pseudospiralis]